jgi:hypothetical protein
MRFLWQDGGFAMATTKNGKRGSAAAQGKGAKPKPGATTRNPGRLSAAKSASADKTARSHALQRSDFMSTAQGQAKTVIYVHGMGNKPIQEVLRCQWDKALFGRGMGERTRLAYWVNRVRYPNPEPASCSDRDEAPRSTRQNNACSVSWA